MLPAGIATRSGNTSCTDASNSGEFPRSGSSICNETCFVNRSHRLHRPDGNRRRRCAPRSSCARQSPGVAPTALPASAPGVGPSPAGPTWWRSPTWKSVGADRGSFCWGTAGERPILRPEHPRRGPADLARPASTSGRESFLSAGGCGMRRWTLAGRGLSAGREPWRHR